MLIFDNIEIDGLKIIVTNDPKWDETLLDYQGKKLLRCYTKNDTHWAKITIPEVAYINTRKFIADELRFILDKKLK